MTRRTARPGKSLRSARAHRSGLWAETIAALWLMFKGYRILERRYRTPVGEIDLIVRRGPVVAYVEVKTRPTLAAALSALSPKSRTRISRAALWYGQKQAPRRPRAGQAVTADKDSASVTGGRIERFDLIAIRPWRLPRHLENAWEQQQTF